MIENDLIIVLDRSRQLELSEMPQPDLKQRKIDDNPSKFDSKDKEDGFADFAETYLKAQDELQTHHLDQDKSDGKTVSNNNIKKTLEEVSTQFKLSEMLEQPQAEQQELNEYVKQFIQATLTLPAKMNDINSINARNEKLATNQTIVNAANAIGNTALFSAIAYKDYDMAKLLLDHGADPNKINNAGLSPLAKASQVVNEIKDPIIKNAFLELISEMEKKNDNSPRGHNFH
ncbi:MAG: ankyrin repeat domain-containing protein [Gammaproteobacteria bacterium]